MIIPPEGFGQAPQVGQEVRLLPPAGYVIEELATKGQTGLLEVLIEQGYDVNATRGDGGTALMGAAMNNHVETSTLLIEKGADLNMQTTDTGVTALLLAVIPGHVETVELLMKHGADPELLTKEGANALMYAADEGHMKVVKTLLKHGADPLFVRNGKSALTFARDKSHPEIIEVLEEAAAHRSKP